MNDSAFELPSPKSSSLPSMIDRSLYFLGWMIVAFIQALPLAWVAQIGRCGGEVIFWLDGRHRKVAIKNLTLCFKDSKTPREIRALAHENFRRIGETYGCAIKTAGMKGPALRKIMEVTGGESLDPERAGDQTENCIYATGHFGNFELFSRLSLFIKGYQCAATYRGMRPAAFNRILFSMRTKAGGSGLLYERRTDGALLKKAMNAGGVLLILVSDQSSRDNGLELPFFGHPCFTTPAPAVMAARYHCSLFVPICYRTGLGRWRIEVGEAIPMRANGVRRSTEAITRDVNTAMETAVRRDPANWFWVHNRWKTKKILATAEAAAAETVATA
jgi:lauroyl/myristoyl acyltransferase